MVVYVLCVQWTVCFSLAGLSFRLSFLGLEDGQYLWAVLVWTRKCGWYSFRNLWHGLAVLRGGDFGNRSLRLRILDIALSATGILDTVLSGGDFESFCPAG